MSTLAIWCRVVQSRDVRSRVFSSPVQVISLRPTTARLHLILLRPYLQLSLYAVYLKGQSLALFCFFYTLLNCRRWYRTVGWTFITMLMTLRFTVSVHWRRLRAQNYSAVFQNALTESPCWLRSSRLQLNTSNTEIIWLSSRRRSFQLQQQPFRAVNDQVAPVHMVRDLGTFIDTDVQMKSNVVKTTAACFAVLHRLRSIRRSVPRPDLQSPVSCLVLSRLDHGNAVLAGNFSSPSEAFAVSDRLSRTTGFFVIKVRPRDATPASTALAECSVAV